MKKGYTIWIQKKISISISSTKDSLLFKKKKTEVQACENEKKQI